MTMTDAELRALCNRFFDAYQESRIDELDQHVLSKDCIIWTNVFGAKHRDENLALIVESQKRHRRRIYNDRIINTFEGGFVIQYTLNVVEHSGRAFPLSVAIVALCSDGRITRLDEYIDPTKSPAWQERMAAEKAQKEAARS